jgi:hypothetical protein
MITERYRYYPISLFLLLQQFPQYPFYRLALFWCEDMKCVKS